MRQIFRRNADARILHAHHGALAHARKFHMHLAAARRILDGVVDNVIKYLLELQAVAHSFAGIADEAGKFDAALACQRRKALDLLGNHISQAQLGGIQVHAVAVDVDQGQKVADDAVEAVDFLVDVREELLLHLRIVSILIEQRFQQDLHRAQRRFQLVRGVGNKLIARHIQLFQPFAHGIEGAGKLGKLVFAAHLHAAGKVAAAHA